MGGEEVRGGRALEKRKEGVGVRRGLQRPESALVLRVRVGQRETWMRGGGNSQFCVVI